MMVRLLGASALALVLTAPAAQAGYHHHYRAFARSQPYSVVRFAPVRRRVASGRYWMQSGAARREAVALRRETAGRSEGDRSGEFAEHRIVATNRVSGGRPRAWCGWYARGLVGGDPGPEYNLARNWAHWGHASSPGVGVMVVWPHHVGMITGRTSDGRWVVKSGNDGGGVARERPRSIAGAIAFRAG